MFPTFISLGYSDDIIHNHLNHILKRKFSKIFIVIKHSHISQQFVFNTAKTSSESRTLQHFHLENMYLLNLLMIKCGKSYQYTEKEDKKYQ